MQKRYIISSLVVLALACGGFTYYQYAENAKAAQAEQISTEAKAAEEAAQQAIATADDAESTSSDTQAEISAAPQESSITAYMSESSDGVEQVSNGTRGSGSSASADADGGATTSEGNSGSSSGSGSSSSSGSSGQYPTDPEDQDGNGLPDWMDEELRRQQEAASGSGPVKPREYYIGKPEPSGTPGNALPSVREGRAVWNSEMGGWLAVNGRFIVYPSGGSANIR